MKNSGAASVYAVWEDDKKRLIGGGDRFVFSFDPIQHSFRRLPNEGLRIALRVFIGDSRQILGIYQGAIDYDRQEFCSLYKAYLGFYLDGLRVLDKDMTVETENTPLGKALSYIAALQLDHDENTFSLTAIAIRCDEIQDIAYGWKLGNTDWSNPSPRNGIRFSNLAPGEYIFSA